MLAWMLAPDGTLLNINKTSLQHIDRTQEEVKGKALWETPWFEGDRSLKENAREWVRLATDGARVEFEADLTDTVGEPLATEGTVRPVLNQNGTASSLLVSARDVTTRKRQEEELRRKSAQLDALFGRSPDMASISDAEGTLLRVNPRLIEESGYREEELIGMKIWELDPSISRQECFEMWAEMEVGDRRRFESILRRKDGSTFPVEVNIRLLQLGGDDQFISTSRNITKRKEAERKLERENERLDRFASVLSHDLRNPLNVAQGRLQLAREQYSTDSADHLSSVGRALGRMDEIIEDMLLLTWSERDIDPDELQTVELEAAARKAWDSVKAPKATCKAESSVRLTAHEGRLPRLLENLFRNAVEHGGKAVTVQIGALDGGFFVEDDGPGIPEEKREQVLEGGYSSQEEGTGLGLSIVQGIAEAHGWSTSVTEGREGGARFEFRGVESHSESHRG